MMVVKIRPDSEAQALARVLDANSLGYLITTHVEQARLVLAEAGNSNGGINALQTSLERADRCLMRARFFSRARNLRISDDQANE